MKEPIRQGESIQFRIRRQYKPTSIYQKFMRNPIVQQEIIRADLLTDLYWRQRFKKRLFKVFTTPKK